MCVCVCVSYAYINKFTDRVPRRLPRQKNFPDSFRPSARPVGGASARARVRENNKFE